MSALASVTNALTKTAGAAYSWRISLQKGVSKTFPFEAVAPTSYLAVRPECHGPQGYGNGKLWVWCWATKQPS